MSIPGVTPEEVMWVTGGAYKAGSWPIRKGYHAAQNAGMRYQNWRHKGAGEPQAHDQLAAVEIPAPYIERSAKKGSGKNWTTDEESFENTTTSHTTYTRKRTR